MWGKQGRAWWGYLLLQMQCPLVPFIYSASKRQAVVGLQTTHWPCSCAVQFRDEFSLHEGYLIKLDVQSKLWKSPEQSSQFQCRKEILKMNSPFTQLSREKRILKMGPQTKKWNFWWARERAWPRARDARHSTFYSPCQQLAGENEEFWKSVHKQTRRLLVWANRG